MLTLLSETRLNGLLNVEGRGELKKLKKLNVISRDNNKKAQRCSKFHDVINRTQFQLEKGKPSGTTGSIKTITNKMAVLTLS